MSLQVKNVFDLLECNGKNSVRHTTVLIEIPVKLITFKMSSDLPACVLKAEGWR